MPHNDYDDDALEPRPRESIMRQRLRAAGHEPPQDDPEVLTPAESYGPAPRRRPSIMRQRLRDTSIDYDDYGGYDEDDYIPRSRSRGGYRSGGGAGCAQAVLYLVLGGIASLLIILFFFGRAFDNVASFFNAPGLPVLIASPTPTIRTSAVTVIQRVQGLNQLQTTSFTIEKVIEAGIEGDALEDLLFGDRLLLIAHGTVVAGIDLEELSEADVLLSADAMSLTLRLPPVRIFGVNLDNSRTRVYDRQQGLLAPPNKDLETTARQRAEESILQAACEAGILQRAAEDSQRTMAQFLSLLDLERVEVLPPPASECVAPAP